VNARAKEIDGDYTNIDRVSISSVARTLPTTVISNSPIYGTKKLLKSKAEDEVAPPFSNHEKRPRTVVASHILLVLNPVSHISLDGKSGAKSLKNSCLKFHVPVKLSWDYGGNMRDISINVLINTSAEDTIFDVYFVEPILMTWVQR